MPLLTHSRLSTYRRCPREHSYRYGLGVAPRETAPALRFGTLVHVGLEAWWLATLHGAPRWPSALQALAGQAQLLGCDPWEHARAVALLCGYEATYGGDGWVAVAVESEWRAALPALPLLDPAQPFSATPGPDLRGWMLAGKFDVIARRGCELAVVEHKHSSMPLDPGGPYWQRLRQDGQVSLYLEGARAMGYEVSHVVYDVLGTADLEPLRATPLEQRKYTKEGKLYVRQRAEDESPAAYQQRLVKAISEQPRRYYARAEVVRLEKEAEEHRAELRTWAARLASDIAAPKNPDACYRYGRMCEYAGVCGGTESLTGERFVRLSWPHPELKRGDGE